MKQQDNYSNGDNSLRDYLGKLVKVAGISLLIGTVGVMVCLAVGYFRLKPLQAIYIGQYLTSASRSSRSETGVSDYRLLLRVVPDPNAKPDTADPSKSKPKGKRGTKDKPDPEEDKNQYLLCNDNQVEPVYLNGGEVRTPENDLIFRLRTEAPDEKLIWRVLSVNDHEMWKKFGFYIYDGESVDDLMVRPRNYGIVLFAISLMVGFFMTTRKHYKMGIREEIREIQQLPAMGFVVTKVEVLKCWLMPLSSHPSTTDLPVIETKAVSIPASDIREVKPLKQRKRREPGQIEAVKQKLFLTEAEQSKEEDESNFGLEIFGGETQGEEK